jgi:hypothetical protein
LACLLVFFPSTSSPASSLVSSRLPPKVRPQRPRRERWTSSKGTLVWGRRTAGT